MKDIIKSALKNKVFRIAIHKVPFLYPRHKLKRFDNFLLEVKNSGANGCFSVLKQFEQEVNIDAVVGEHNFKLLSFITLTLINPPEAWDKYDQKLFVFDKNGKVKVKYPFGINFNPTSLCQYALSIYDTYYQHKLEKYKELFFKQVEFLIEEAEETEDEFRVPYRYDFFDMVKGPWLSGLAQAQAASVLLRAYILNKDLKYLKLAKKAQQVINSSNKLDIVVNGYRWVEEYPTDKPSCVINGLAWVMISLLELSKFFPEDQQLQKMILDLLKTYKENLWRYDLEKGKVRYSLMSERLVNNSYRGFQCLQMLHLYYYTKDQFFYNQHIKWQDNFDHAEFVAAYLPFNIINRRLRDISKGM